MSPHDVSNRSRNHQFERVAWVLFLIMLGGLTQVPAPIVPPGTWLVGTGLILLGLNAVRALNGIAMSAVTLVPGGDCSRWWAGNDDRP